MDEQKQISSGCLVEIGFAGPSDGIDRKLLLDAFQIFTSTGETIARSYQELQEKIQSLNLELEESNRQLTLQLAATQQISSFLKGILESMETAVVVIGNDTKVLHANASALNLFGNSDRIIDAEFGPILQKVYGDKIPLDRFFSSSAENEIAFPDSQGREIVLRVRGCGTVLPDGEPTGRLLIIEDITETFMSRRENERTERLLAMGELAVRIVHEIRNPMGSIDLIASLLAKDLENDKPKCVLAEKIRNGIASMNHIISNLLSFTRNRKPDKTPILVHDLIEDSLSFVEYIAKGSDVRIFRDYLQEVFFVQADSELCKQVLINLFMNSIQAMPDGGKLTVSTTIRRFPGPAGSEPRPFLQIKIADTGCGMTPEQKERIFDPFFTTKEKGTGLGMAIVQGIVHAHGGFLGVDSTQGKGTIITVVLPLVNNFCEEKNVD